MVFVFFMVWHTVGERERERESQFPHVFLRRAHTHTTVDRIYSNVSRPDKERGGHRSCGSMIIFSPVLWRSAWWDTRMAWMASYPFT